MHIAIAYINIYRNNVMMQVDYNESLVIKEDSMVDEGYYFEYGPQYKIGTFGDFNIYTQTEDRHCLNKVKS